MFRSSYKCSGTLISVPEQLVSATEQLGYADFLHTMTPIRFHSFDLLGEKRALMGYQRADTRMHSVQQVTIPSDLVHHWMR